jgi:hypothetical protein
MYLLMLGGPLEEGKRTVLHLLMAISVAASAAFLGGDAAAKGTIPFFKDSPVTFSVWGGVGSFVVVYLILRYAN